MKIEWQTYTKHTETEIRGFFGEYRFLSNYHLCPIWFEGLLYPSTENAYQAAKVALTDRPEFLKMTPPESKRAWKGKSIYTPERWDAIKDNIMYRILVEKFGYNEQLGQLLKNTGGRYLEETNSWGDAYWGFDVNTQSGQNVLGTMLMQIRKILK